VSATVQKRLVHDQKTLATDVAARASQQVLAADTAKITFDRAALVTATAPTTSTATAATAPAGPSPASAAATASPVAKTVDSYL
jgi:hypothetical protein